MPRYEKLEKPERGTPVTVLTDGTMQVPADPIVPFIQGDGIGPEIWNATRLVVDASVEKAFRGRRCIAWHEVYAGEKARELYGPGVWLPEDTLQAIQEYSVAIKGPLSTPPDGETHSSSIELRRKLCLFAGIRPCRWLKGVPSPVRAPEKMDVVVIQDNTEDLSSGHEWEQGSYEAKKLISFAREELGTEIARDSSVAIKPISETASRRLVRAAIEYALENRRQRVTLVHQGNIMRRTECAFRDWGYQLAKDEFPEKCLTEAEVADNYDGKLPRGRIVIDDSIAASVLRQLLVDPGRYDVLACPSVNGVYISNACAGQIGGAGMAPCANVGERVAVFETVHGTSSRHAGKDRANPGALVLAGKMLLEHLGWRKAAQLIERGMEGAVAAGTVTFDFKRMMDDATLVACSEYADAIVRHMD